MQSFVSGRDTRRESDEAHLRRYSGNSVRVERLRPDGGRNMRYRMAIGSLPLDAKTRRLRLKAYNLWGSLRITTRDSLVTVRVPVYDGDAGEGETGRFRGISVFLTLICLLFKK